MNKTVEKRDIVILGAGGHAHVIADIVTAMGRKVVAFLDDDIYVEDRSGNISDYYKYEDVAFVIGIGNADIREKLSKELNVEWFTAIHPSAIISDSAKVGQGTVIMPNAVINARAIVGKHCIINTGSIIEHDNNISDFAHISVGAKLGGTVSIGRKTWIGIGASIKNNISICDNCLIGAGATVVKEVSESGTYVGLPAKRVK